MAGAISQYIIQSNIEQVDLHQTLSLTHTKSSYNVTLIATLTDNGNPMIGESVVFYQCDSEGTPIGSALGSNTTNDSGIAFWLWQASINGTYYFKATYAVD